jgi:TRAP-type C4-dicarboxylate transport system permease small subunit
MTVQSSHPIRRLNNFVMGIITFVGCTVLTLMMLLIAADVCCRYLLNRPIAGGFEITEYFMAVLVPLAIAFCEKFRGHISVDMVVSRFSEKAQLIIDSVTSILTLLLYALIAWQSVIYVGQIFESKLASTVLLIPTYPFVIPLVLGFAVLCLLLAGFVFRTITQLKGGRTDEPH